ncbi:MAG: peptidoglycan DD-metalloendopeptidase family protein [Phormidesmis sp.]
MREHTVASGDTVATVAAAYRIDAATLLRFNPNVGSTLAPGSKLVIPPFNGIVVSAAVNETWQTLAERYGSRADLLFEVNGCVADVPGQIFVPGALAIGAPSVAAVASVPVSQSLGYPLANPADVVMSYGWQPNATSDELVFNSGIAFAISMPNDVLAAKRGTVAFTGEQQGYGTLVVINHADGLQTRYANLSDISVSVGQSVAAEDLVGQVGSTEGATFLYFEVRKNSAEGWVAQDPGKYVPALDLR